MRLPTAPVVNHTNDVGPNLFLPAPVHECWEQPCRNGTRAEQWPVLGSRHPHRSLSGTKAAASSNPARVRTAGVITYRPGREAHWRRAVGQCRFPWKILSGRDGRASVARNDKEGSNARTNHSPIRREGADEGDKVNFLHRIASPTRPVLYAGLRPQRGGYRRRYWGENRCNRSDEGVTSAAGVAAEAPGGVLLGKIGLGEVASAAGVEIEDLDRIHPRKIGSLDFHHSWGSPPIRSPKRWTP